MKSHNPAYLLFCLTVILASCTAEKKEPTHPFEAYLSEIDPAYSYELEKSIEGENYTAHVLRMVSQNWLTDDLVDQTEWWHWLTIVVPDQIEYSKGLLIIGGGDRNDPAPESVHPLPLDAALATNSVTAYLHNIPFQPITFLNEDPMDARVEDEIIAYGWRHFLENGAKIDDAEWLSRLPMTAAAQRAMDTVTDFVQDQHTRKVDSFVVAGASKRGWTTWTTGIFDDRVIAIAPLVIDLLNLGKSFSHHWRVYGEWSPAIEDYENEKIMEWQDSKEFDRLLELIDPHSYSDSLDMPKYIINAASDEFFVPDSWRFYWNDLPSPKLLRYIPNTGHSLTNTDFFDSFISYYDRVLNERSFPEFTWTADTTGFQIVMDPNNLPDKLLLWNAHNPTDRDFRLYVIDRVWLAKNLSIPDSGRISVDIDSPDNGFTAWLVEATYNADNKFPFKVTTGIVVTPERYPYEPFIPSDSLRSVSINE